MKTLTTVIVIAILVIIGVVLFKNQNQEAVIAPSEQVSMTETGSTSETETEDAGIGIAGELDVSVAGTVKEFTVTGKNFSFTPATLKVKKGDTVKITLINADGFHDLKIDEFNVATKKIQTGQQETITFVADKTGTFEYYCSVGDHRQMGMKGTLTIEE